MHSLHVETSFIKYQVSVENCLFHDFLFGYDRALRSRRVILERMCIANGYTRHAVSKFRVVSPATSQEGCSWLTR